MAELKIKQTSQLDKLLETLNKEVFEQYYFSHSIEECLENFSLSKSQFYRVLKKFGTRKRTKEEQVTIYLRIYGVDNPGNTAEAVEKRKQTCLDRYGCACVTQTTAFKKKAEQTKLDRYGDVHYVNAEKGLMTKIETYGEDFVKDQLKHYTMEKYGVDNISQVPEIVEKRKQHFIDRHGLTFAEYMVQISSNLDVISKRKATCIERYGTDYASQFAIKAAKNIDYQQTSLKSSATMQERYGVNNPGQLSTTKLAKKLYDSEAYEKAKQFVEERECVLIKDICEMFCINSMAVYTFLDKYNLIVQKIGRYSYITLEDFHKIEPDINNWQQSSRTRSALEEEVYTFIKGIYSGPIKLNDRTILSPKELDIYLPDLKLAIEVNGLFYHSTMVLDTKYTEYPDAEKEIKTRHYAKSKSCREANVRLIHIYENEWRNSVTQEKLKSLLSSAIGVNSTIKYARKCQVRLISDSEARAFNNKYHLQGHRPAKITYGLFSEGQLVQIMSFSNTKYNRNLKSETEWEIIRSCTVSNTTIVGGLSKLFKHFLKNHTPDKIFSYCDFNKFDGAGYYTLGMSYIGDTGPDMHWIMKVGATSTSAEQYAVVARTPSKHKELKDTSCGQIFGSGSMKFVWIPQTK